MQEYELIRLLAAGQGFSSFTELQETAFCCPEAYDESRDLFIIGETSSGKTLIPTLLYCRAVARAREMGEPLPKMLFVVPYRALAAQKLEELQEALVKADDRNRGLRIVQSTGEFQQNDQAIQQGEVDVAIIIGEKVYKYEAREEGFLNKYDFLVMDEIGLISTSERGVRMDFVLAWAANQRRQHGSPRIIALATPFFDWSAYIDNYGFHPIRATRRPVELAQGEVTYDTGGRKILSVSNIPFLRRSQMKKQSEVDRAAEKPLDESPRTNCDSHPAGKCPFHEPCRYDDAMLCPHSGGACEYPLQILPEKVTPFRYILLEICRYHLAMDHQVLIFINDRQQVKELTKFLYKNLAEWFPTPPSPEACRKAVLEECHLEGEDVYGILEYEDGSTVEDSFYESFWCGVAFHSAALPNELRTYVEKKLLNSRRMKIVCSTETLAFGVNSTVDAVVIADLTKRLGGAEQMLSMNEFQNYAGRAGRMRRDLPADAVRGYVYTLVKASQQEQWAQMQAQKDTPECVYSLFHVDEGQRMPFFLLNVLPMSGNAAITIEAMARRVALLPRQESFTDASLQKKLQESLQFLLAQGLVAEPVDFLDDGRDEEASEEKRYCLTALGKSMRGYVLGRKDDRRTDYELLVDALDDYVTGIFASLDKVSFLYQLLDTKHAESGLNSVFEGSKSRIGLTALKTYIRSVANPEHELEWLDDCDDEKQLSILAALLAWCVGESTKTLYRMFGIQYSLLKKLTEQLSYLIEISQCLLPDRIEKMWRKKRQGYARFGIGEEDYLEAMDSARRQNALFFKSIYYGINTDIAVEILHYLKTVGETDPSAAALAEAMSLQYVDPKLARVWRQIAVRYRFFSLEKSGNRVEVETDAQMENRRRQYRADLLKISPHIRNFFREKFGEQFD